MRIGRATGGARIVWAGDGDSAWPFLISPPAIRDYALIFSYLADRIARPDDAPDGWEPDLTDEASVAELRDNYGFVILLYIVTRRDQPYWRLGEMEALAGSLNDVSRDLVYRMALIREWSRPANVDHWKPPGEGGGMPLHRANIGKMLMSANVRRFDPITVGGWTVDQLENRLIGGEPSPEDGEPMTEAEISRYMKRSTDPNNIMQSLMDRETPLTVEEIATLELRGVYIPEEYKLMAKPSWELTEFDAVKPPAVEGLQPGQLPPDLPELLDEPFSGRPRGGDPS